MGLRSGGGAMLEVPLDGGGGMVVTCLLGGGGGSGGHKTDPISRGSCAASLALILGARVPVGRPCGSIQIRSVCLYAGHVGGELSIGMTSTGPSSSSSSATATLTTSSTSVIPSSPSLIPSGDNTGCLCATGYGHGPIPWMAQGGSWRLLGEVAGSEGSIGQWAGGVGEGEGDGNRCITLTLGLGIFSGA
jgi:hypothetical protein